VRQAVEDGVLPRVAAEAPDLRLELGGELGGLSSVVAEERADLAIAHQPAGVPEPLLAVPARLEQIVQRADDFMGAAGHCPSLL
jgi:hypothetical protein